jgi:hypothetical protein
MGFITTAYMYGLGKHDVDLTFSQIVNVLKWSWLNMIPGTCVSVLARTSSAIFLNRLFGVRVWFKWYLVIFTTLQCIGGILVLLVNWLGVSPIEALWNPTVQTTSKMNPVIALDTAYAVQGELPGSPPLLFLTSVNDLCDSSFHLRGPDLRPIPCPHYLEAQHVHPEKDRPRSPNGHLACYHGCLHSKGDISPDRFIGHQRAAVHG